VAAQVVAADVTYFCDTTAEVISDILKALLDGTYFTVRLANETSLGWSLVTWGYVTSAVVAVRLMSPPWSKLFAVRSQLTEAFRQALGRLLTHSEAIAALGGEGREGSIILQRFEAMHRHLSKMIHVQWRFGMVEDFVAKYCASTIAMIVILGPFFGGNLRTDYTPAGNAATLATMRYVTSVIINQLTAIAGLARCLRKIQQLQGVAKRVGGMAGVLMELGTQESANQAASIRDGNCIAFEDVEVVTPMGDKLVEALSFAIEPGTNLLISGPNGAGKSS
jgi:ABC-type uncharacterized transport system fused permease/ATPase subunit